MSFRKEIQKKILEIYEKAVLIYEKIWEMTEEELKEVHKEINEYLEELADEIESLYNKILITYSPERYPRTYQALRGFILNTLFDEKLLKNRKYWRFSFPIGGELPKPRRRIEYIRHPFFGRTIFEAMKFVLFFIDAIDIDKRSWLDLDILRVKIERPNVTYYFYVKRNWNKRLRIKHVPSEYKPSAGRNMSRYDYAAQLRSIIFLGASGFRISTSDFPSRWIPAPETKYGRRLEYDFSSIPVIREEVVDDERRFIIDFSGIDWLPDFLDLSKIKTRMEEYGAEIDWVSEWWE